MNTKIRFWIFSPSYQTTVDLHHTPSLPQTTPSKWCLRKCSILSFNIGQFSNSRNRIVDISSRIQLLSVPSKASIFQSVQSTTHSDRAISHWNSSEGGGVQPTVDLHPHLCNTIINNLKRLWSSTSAVMPLFSSRQTNPSVLPNCESRERRENSNVPKLEVW